MPHDHGGDQPRTVYSAHLPGHDHEHDDEAVGPLEDNPLWQQDNVTLHSVGIDIGSSGTQILFSRLHLRRVAEDLTSRYVVVDRRTTYRSPVALTPYTGAEHIDAEALGTLVDTAYAAAGTDPAAIDTGVVILTGEALRRRNAEAIAGVLATRAGDLVTATAGHHMEAMLAAYGSGAAKISHDAGNRLLLVDIGGGTTKLALIDRGRITATAAVHVGGRLQVSGPDGRLTRLETAGARHAARAGVTRKPGDHVTDAEREHVATTMAETLLALLAGARPPAGDDWLALTDPLPGLDGVDGVMFSGGVAEYVYHRETRDFGDLGRPLGHALRRRIDAGALPWPLLPPGECIRATALGASEYSVQLSGNTGCVTDPGALLPRRDLAVVRPRYDLGEHVDAAAIAAAVRRRLAETGAADSGGDIALALSWSGPPAHARLHALATAVRDGTAGRTARGLPLYVVLDGDVAMTLGRLLRDELGVTVPLLVLDGLALRDFDHIDLGRLRYPSNTVPVTIKSLVFHEEPPAG